jgi:dTDP-4-dehydrorhamnose 3,5-epimerase
MLDVWGNLMPSVGTRDTQTVSSGGASTRPPSIAGVHVHQLGNVMTRSGWLTEVFRTDWPGVGTPVHQVTWAHMNPGAVTDWHAHSKQTDRIVGVSGNIKLALWDGRDVSPTKGATQIVRIGAARPVMVIVPPEVWHGLRNESGSAAGYINIVDQLYDYEDPDNWRLAARASEIPDIL